VLNMVVVVGKLAKPLQIRNLPSGLLLACFDLQVVRSDESADTVPVALFNSGDEMPNWPTGQALLAVGRVRRRFFRVGGATQSRTEVVAEKVLPILEKDDVRRVLAEASQVLAQYAERALQS
jgi:single-strand DNA-binding protein